MGIQELALVGMRIDVEIGKMLLNPASKNPSAMIVSWPNRRERLWKARDAWQRIKAARSSDPKNGDSEG